MTNCDNNYNYLPNNYLRTKFFNNFIYCKRAFVLPLKDQAINKNLSIFAVL